MTEEGVLDRPRLSVHSAFAATPAGGNIAAVVFSQTQLSTARMQLTAHNLALPTTAFAVLDDHSGIDARMFTSEAEIDSCGHASAALAAEVYRIGNGNVSEITTRSSGGDLAFRVTGPKALPLVGMTVPVHGWRLESQPAPLSGLLGVPIETEVPLARVDTGLSHLIVAVESRQTFTEISLDHDSWRRFGKSVGVDTVGVVALGSDGGVWLRDICVPIGDTEEAASGTTATAVSWHLHQLGYGDRFAVRQGNDMGRPSLLQTSVKSEAVEVNGRVKRIAIGHLDDRWTWPRDQQGANDEDHR